LTNLFSYLFILFYFGVHHCCLLWRNKRLLLLASSLSEELEANNIKMGQRFDPLTMVKPLTHSDWPRSEGQRFDRSQRVKGLTTVSGSIVWPWSVGQTFDCGQRVKVWPRSAGQRFDHGERVKGLTVVNGSKMNSWPDLDQSLIRHRLFFFTWNPFCYLINSF